MSAPVYRPDIDGLRALAILPVVLFHYGLGCAGGFVGVDVFFVISGYLITGIIAGDLRAGRFTLADFYERRIRRILPPLVPVLLVTLGAGLVLLTPRELVRFANELWWSGFFSTNFLYFRKDGYFDGASNMRLLLHSWSLAVEEQFYILMPLLLRWGFHSREQAPLRLLTGLALLSGLWATVAVFWFPSAAFYLLPARAWELLCGALLALCPALGQDQARLRPWAGLAGLTMVLLAIVTYSADTPFPGVAALLPCLGTVAMIWAGHGERTTGTVPSGLVTKLLSLPAPVALGKISYPVYLWHWPLLVLFRYSLLRDPTPAEALLLAGLTVALATASTLWLEAPVRRHRWCPDRRRLFLLTACGLLLLLGSGRILIATKGLPQRLNAEAQHYLAQYNQTSDRYNSCNNRSLSQIQTGDVCQLGPAEQPLHFALWGDSHASALLPLFDRLASQSGQHGVHFSFPGCPPLLELDRNQPQDGFCREKVDSARAQIERSGIRTIFWTVRWPIYSEGWSKVGTDARNKPFLLSDPQTRSLGPEENRAVIDRGLQRTLAWAQQRGIRIIVLDPIPENAVEVPNALAMAALLHRSPAAYAPDRQTVLQRQQWILGQLQQAEAAGRLTRIPVLDIFCPEGQCLLVRDGLSLYRDADHLTEHGAMMLEPVLRPYFTAALPPSR